jgi:hypothetical protein
MNLKSAIIPKIVPKNPSPKPNQNKIKPTVKFARMPKPYPIIINQQPTMIKNKIASESKREPKVAISDDFFTIINYLELVTFRFANLLLTFESFPNIITKRKIGKSSNCSYDGRSKIKH